MIKCLLKVTALSKNNDFIPSTLSEPPEQSVSVTLGWDDETPMEGSDKGWEYFEVTFHVPAKDARRMYVGKEFEFRLREPEDR